MLVHRSRDADHEDLDHPNAGHRGESHCTLRQSANLPDADQQRQFHSPSVEVYETLLLE